MKKMMKKWIAILLVVAMALSSTGCVGVYLAMELADRVENGEDGRLALEEPACTETPILAVPDGQVSQSPAFARQEINFSDMEYVHPDTDAIYAAIDALEADLQAGETDSETLIARYNEILDMYSAADSQLSLAYVLYAFDVTDSYFQDEYNDLTVTLTDMDLALTDLSIALFEDEDSAEGMDQSFGEDFEAAVYAGEKLNSPEIQDDFEQEQRLTTEYDTLLTTFALEDGGNTYTMEEISALSATDYDEYVRLFDAYYAQLNEKAGTLFLKLAALRNRISETLDYDNYAEYQYACYGRDYSLDEIRSLHAAVKEYLVPLYSELLIDAYINGDSDTLSKMQVPLGNFMNKLQVALSDFSPETLEALNFMLRNDLYTTTVSEKKMESNFTTYFSSYESPFIFTQWQDDSWSASTMMHELGHFTNYYLNPNCGWSVSDPLDLAEIDSQGLEMLLVSYYGDLFGGYADAMREQKILDGLYSVISGCMEDEFQQEVYRNPGMTLEEMNELYLRLAGEYGFGELYDYVGTEWVAIPHTFQSPMYYISYAVSMIPALELYVLLQEDADAASEAYHAILRRPAYSELRTITQENGLHDPIAPATIRYLADRLRAALDD